VASQGNALQRTQPGRSRADRPAIDRRHDGAPNPDQPPNRGNGQGRAAVPALRACAGFAGQSRNDLYQGRWRSRALHRGETMSDVVTFDSLPNIVPEQLHPIDVDALVGPETPRHPPQILVLYGSLRQRPSSRLASEEAGRMLRWYGCDVRTFNPSGLPLPDDAESDHPKVRELRDLAEWSDGMMWVSPERHGAMTGLMKAQIDWIPLALGGVRPTQGKTLAIMEV